MASSGVGDVFMDICAQREYLDATGARPCVNAATASTNIRRVMALARWARLPVLSCVDTRRPNQIGDEQPSSLPVDDLCRSKPAFTLLQDRCVIQPDNCLSVSLDIFVAHQQVILPKYHRDPYTNPKLDRLTTEMPALRFVVFGASLETSIRILVLGLLRRNRRVALLEDACGFWNQQEAGMVLRQLGVKGCEILRTDSLVRAARPRPGSPRRRSVA